MPKLKRTQSLRKSLKKLARHRKSWIVAKKTMLTVRIRQRKPSLKKPRHAKTTTPQRTVAETGLRLPTKPPKTGQKRRRSEEHTSELQSLMHLSYAVLCLTNKSKMSIGIVKNNINTMHNDDN